MGGDSIMQGILVIAHGSSNPEWVSLVDKAVSYVNSGHPIVCSFLEMVDGRCIQNGIDELERRGVTHILVVPLFVSSGSTHIQEIRHLLGLPQEMELNIEEEPLCIQADVEMASPMDDHPLIMKILEKRVHALCISPQEETLLLVGHGSKIESFSMRWESMMERTAHSLQKTFGFKEVKQATLLPDQLKDLALEDKNSKVIVVPLFLSEGYFTKKVIPARLQGVNCIYDGKTYLPDPLITEWIESVVVEYVGGSPLAIG